MTGAILGLVHWAGLHPQLAGLLVALIACAESLAFVGLIVPGALMMIGAGTLIGVGALGFWSTFLWAAGGAVVGDGLSFWLGHRYSDRLGRLRWVCAHPEMLTRGRVFLTRHGGKSIFLARFVGPVRPVLPVVAGMLGMSPFRFYLNDVLSALAWAPAYLIPGIVFGASLALAGEVAGRLALGLSLLLVAVWLSIWVVRWGYRRFQPQAGAWAACALHWGRRHPRLAWLVGDLVDPARPASWPLLLWLALLIGGTWLFFGVLEDVIHVDPLVYAGQGFYHLLQQLRTPLGDRIVTTITELGDAAVIIPLILAVSVWLAWQRAWRDLLYWLAAVGFGALAVVTIKAALHLPRPVALYSGMDAYSFPSGHATMSTVIYGFLAVLSAPSVAARWRWFPYTLATLLVGGIAFSRLYLGAHWLADVVAGVALGGAWVALLAIARARRPAISGSNIPWLPQLALVVFAVAAGWHVQHRLDADLERYAVHQPVQQVEAEQWWESGWRALPAYRLDLEGERKQPLNFQWAGGLDVLQRVLAAASWHRPLALTPRSALRWLLPGPALEQLPVVPQLHDGRYEALVLVGGGTHRNGSGRQLILRLWPTATILRAPTVHLWVGTVAWLRVERLPLLSFPRDAAGYDDALARLRPALRNMREKMVQRPPHVDEDGSRWSGATLLAGQD